MADILETLMGSTPNESSHDLQCRCFAAADEIKRLRNVLAKLRHQNEATGGLSALTELLGDLADQFECHAASRGIGQVEEAGRAMRAAKHEIERLRDAANVALGWLTGGMDGDWRDCDPAKLLRDVLSPNAEASGARSVPLDAPVGRGKD